jgi:hypothetical protein
MVTALGSQLGIAPTCAALGVPRATYYRYRRPRSAPRPRRRPPRALPAAEQAAVLAVLRERRFVDLAPAEASQGSAKPSPTALCQKVMLNRVSMRWPSFMERGGAG